MPGTTSAGGGEVARSGEALSGEWRGGSGRASVAVRQGSVDKGNALVRNRGCLFPGRARHWLAALLILGLAGVRALAQPTPVPRFAGPAARFTATAARENPDDVNLRSANIRSATTAEPPQTSEPIVIGFVGGFVKRGDRRHVEVQFANRIRERYSRVHADVYSNHQGALAFRQILTLLDTNHDGVLTTSEKREARIILYGHSWGGSETVELARELGKDGIPVLLTIQIDSITKPGQQGSLIPSNVASAVNFYQTHGILHGSPAIRAADPARTRIIGNFRMTYKAHRVQCDEYPWYSRLLTRSHIEIESDPRVWSDIGSLIDAELRQDPSESSQPGSPGNLR